jgi:repressor LexA
MLTPKQKAVMEFIQEFSSDKGYSPSQQEIATHFGFKSLGTVQNYLVRLQRHGFLRKTWNGKRTTEIDADAVEQAMDSVLSNTTRLKSRFQKSLILKNLATETLFQTQAVPSPSHCLPVLGRVAAGRPIEYSEIGEIDIPTSMIRKGKLDQSFVLRVKGDSMICDGILDGDYVVIQRQSIAEQGETVVAMIGNEATIKRYYRKTHKGHPRIELHSANPAYEPILVDSLTETHGFKIEGVLVGVVRKL